MSRLLCIIGIHDWHYSTNGGMSGNWIHEVKDCDRCGKHRFLGRRRRTKDEMGIPVLTSRQIDGIVLSYKR